MNSQKEILFINKPGQFMEVVICAIPDWDGFDKLIQFLKNEYDVKVINSVDGPGVRRWVLKVEDQEFELIHDDGYGNYLFTSMKSSESLIEKIGLDLERRFLNL